MDKEISKERDLLLLQRYPWGTVKDLSKMKAQYAMFVNAVGSKQVTQ
jgi:hypothetical protein